MQKHNSVQQKHMYKMHTFTHASAFELGRCVTDVRPLLTPDVAQQGVFVWFPKATVREGGGGWSREAGLQPHVLLWFVCMSDCCMHACVPVEAAGGLFARCHWMAVFVYGCMCIWFYVHVCVCAWAQCGKCCCLQANCYWQAHTDYWSQKVKCTLCSFLSPEAPSFCLSNFLSSHFYFLYFSLCHSLLLFLSPWRFLSFAPSPLPPSLMILAEVWLIGHRATMSGSEGRVGMRWRKRKRKRENGGGKLC